KWDGVECHHSICEVWRGR
ncbi:hypothetical protein AVEN_187993-1, partial [Araneus ventricosus]